MACFAEAAEAIAQAKHPEVQVLDRDLNVDCRCLELAGRLGCFNGSSESCVLSKK